MQDPTSDCRWSPLAPQDRRAFEEQLLPLFPALVAYARAVTRNAVEADDLASETVVRALASYRSFAVGSNMQAWLFTILRHRRSSSFRKTQPESLADAQLEQLSTAPNQ